MSLHLFFSIIFFSFQCSYQHGKVDWLALCKCFILLKNNIANERNYFYIPSVSETQSDCDEKPGRGLIFQWCAPEEERELDFTECVHLNLLHCLSFGKAQSF